MVGQGAGMCRSVWNNSGRVRRWKVESTRVLFKENVLKLDLACPSVSSSDLI